MNLKQQLARQLVGTPLGRLAMWSRETAHLAHLLVSPAPERLACRLNDRLAVRLVTSLPCEVFVDVGAHVGSIASEVMRLHPEAKVYAVEAVPEKAAALRSRFPGLTVFACAAGEEHKQTSFFVDRGRPGCSSLTAMPGGVEISVSVRPLDSLVTRADVIKVDVEGAELDVLRGATRIIDESDPIIMFESAPNSERSNVRTALWNHLDVRGYEVLVPDRLAYAGPGLSREGFEESHFYPRRTTNYFAVHRHRRKEVRQMALAIIGGSQERWGEAGVER